MKTGTHINVDNHTQTVITCSDCGATTHVKAGLIRRQLEMHYSAPVELVTPFTIIIVDKAGGFTFD